MTSAAHPSPTLEVLRRPAFAWFFATQALTAFNDNFFKTAVSLWVKTHGKSAFGLDADVLAAIAPALLVLPFFFFSAIAGQLADKLDKPRIARAVKGAEVAIMIVAAVALSRGATEALLGCVLAMGIHSAVFGPVKYGILPELATSDQLVGANALVETGTFVAILLGTIGGSVAVLANASPLAIGALLIFVALVGSWTVRRVPALGAAAPALKIAREPVRPTLEVLSLTRRNRTAWLSALGISWFWLLGAVMLSRLPYFMIDDLHAPAAATTVALALFCVGIALGAMATEKISGRNLELGLVPVGAFLMAAFLVDLAFASRAPLEGAPAYASLAEFVASPRGLRVCFDLLAFSVSGGFFSVPLYTLLQQRTAPTERARIVAGNNILNAVFMVAGSVALAIATHLHISTFAILLTLAASHAIASVCIYRLLPEFLMRLLAWVLSRVMYRVEVSGLQHVPEHGAAIVVCNHVSYVDWLIIAGAIRRPTRFVMDHRIAAMPLLSRVFRDAKAIPIAPAKEDPALMEAAFEAIAQALRDGELVCIFPEGALTKDGEIAHFKRGIERVVTETPVPVVPAALAGLWGSMFSHHEQRALTKAPHRFRARVRLRFDAPLEAEHASAESLEHRVRALQLELREEGVR